MDRLDEHLFGVVLSSLNARNGCRLGSTCKTFRRWVDESHVWRLWLEEDFPSLKTSPIKEIVDSHYGMRAMGLRRSYKQLFLGWWGLPSEASLPLKPGPAQLEGEASQLPAIGDFIIILDVLMGDERVLSHTASCEGMVQDVNATDEAGVHFRGLFRTTCSVEEEGKLRTEFQQLAKKAPKRVNVRCLYSPGPRIPSQHSLKLLSRADGQVHNLMDREPCGFVGRFIEMPREMYHEFEKDPRFEDGWCESPVFGLVIEAKNSKFSVSRYDFQVVLHQAKLLCSGNVTHRPAHVVLDFQNMRNVPCNAKNIYWTELGRWEGFPRSRHQHE